MKRLATIALSLLLSSTAWGAAGTIYVSATRADDTGNGTTWALAKQTIAAAVALSATYDPLTIRVAPGDYPETAYSGRIQITNTQNAKTISIAKYIGADGGANACPVGDGAVTLTANTTYLLWLRGSWTSGSLTLDAINFNNQANAATIGWDALSGSASTSSLTVKNCTLTNSGSYQTYLIGIDQVSRSLVMDNVTFVNNATNGEYLYVDSASLVWVKNCTVNRDTHVPDAPLFMLGLTANATVGQAIFDSNTITVGYYSSSYSIIGDGTCISGYLILRNNVVDTKTHFVRLLGNAAAPGVKLVAMDNTVLCRPVASNQDVTAFSVGDSTDNAKFLSAPVILRNTITCNSHSSGHSAGVFLGTACNGGLVGWNTALGFDQAFYFYGNYGTFIMNMADGADAYIVESGVRSSGGPAWVTSTAYVAGNQVSSGGVMYQCLVNHTSGTFATDLAAAKWNVLPRTSGRANNFLFNTGYSDSDYPTTGTAGTLCFRDGAANTSQPLENVALYNALHASGSTSTNTVVFNAHSGTMAISSNILDYNVYWLDGGGTGGLQLLNSTQSGTPAGNRSPLAFSDWSSFTGGTQYNDVHSVIANPGFLNAAARDLRITGTAALGNKATFSLPTWNDKGAWQYVGPSGTRLRRVR